VGGSESSRATGASGRGDDEAAADVVSGRNVRVSQLDEVSFRLGTPMQILGDSGRGDAVVQVVEWGRILGSFRARLVGLPHWETGPCDVRAYFTRGR
jgi:hypothetical protein